MAEELEGRSVTLPMSFARMGKGPGAGTAGPPRREQKEMTVKLLDAVRTSNTPLVNIIREGRMKISPDLARRAIGEAAYEGQRKVYAHHVALLADAMRRGKWSDGSQICFARMGWELFLVNGNHRMHAVVESGEIIEFQVLIQRVETIEEVESLYYRFDVTQRKRSVAEILSAAKIGDRHGISRTMATAVYEAVALITNGFDRPHYQSDPVKARSVDARLDAAKAWWEHAKVYESLIKPAPAFVLKKLRNQGVAAVGLVTCKYQPDKAAEFWGGVAKNDGLRKGDPRHTFITDIAGRKLNVGTFKQGAQAAALPWNAFMDGRSLKIIKVYADPAVRIAGTPFDGSRE